MDAACVAQYSAKLKRLLDALLKPDYQIRNENHFNRLLTELCASENSTTKSILSLDVFSEWIIQACAFWEGNEDVHPTASVGRFVLELTALVSKNETHFLQLSGANAYLRLCDAFRVRKNVCSASVKLAYVKLLKELLEHKSGVEWIKATNIWIDVLNYCLSTNEENVFKDSCNFMYILLECRICYDESFCNTVVKRILQPLMLNSLKTNETSKIDEEYLKIKLQPTLRLIVALLEQYLENEWTEQRYLHIPNKFFNEHRLLYIVTTYMMFVTDEELVFEFSNIVCLIYSISLGVYSKQYMITEDESVPFIEKVFTLIEESINKKYCRNVLKLSYLAIKYWYLISSRLLPIAYKDINKDPANFQNQIVIIQAMPIFQFLEDYFKFDWNMDELDDMRDFYYSKVCRQMCEYTIRLTYNYRDALVATTQCDYQVAMKALHFIIQSRRYYEYEPAVVMFQSLIYILNDIVAIAKVNTLQLDLARNEPDFFFEVVYGIKDFIENFDIKWTNCMESVCVVNVALDFLLLTTWPAKLTIEALKLLELSIRKYMAPNLALLVDRTSDSSLGQLGPLLTSKLLDDEWEIRENCIAVLKTISELAHKGFPAVQGILQQENFPFLILKLCLEDSKDSVRAGALKCLQEMVQSPLLYEIFEEQELPKVTLQILSSEFEGIVRLEAATLVHGLYLQEKFEELSQVYETMSAAATIDLHWKVKKKALEFWDEVIWESLKNQGVIDGKFPEVTFSKENRKIVMLNGNEIKKRLQRVLLELNINGCLDVLSKAVQEDCDIEVVEKAVEVTKKFVTLLNKYQFTPINWQIINEHLDCSNSTSLGKDGVDQFFDFVRQDLDKILENRKKWLNHEDGNFDSLLDSILRDYEHNEEVSDMQCC